LSVRHERRRHRPSSSHASSMLWRLARSIRCIRAATASIPSTATTISATAAASGRRTCLPAGRHAADGARQISGPGLWAAGWLSTAGLRRRSAMASTGRWPAMPAAGRRPARTAIRARRRTAVPPVRRRSTMPPAGWRSAPAGTVVPIPARTRTVVIAAADRDTRRWRAVVAVARVLINALSRITRRAVPGRIGISRATAQHQRGRYNQQTSNCGFHDGEKTLNY
jgi:hypothetical protein